MLYRNNLLLLLFYNGCKVSSNSCLLVRCIGIAQSAGCCYIKRSQTLSPNMYCIKFSSIIIAHNNNMFTRGENLQMILTYQFDNIETFASMLQFMVCILSTVLLIHVIIFKSTIRQWYQVIDETWLNQSKIWNGYMHALLNPNCK